MILVVCEISCATREAAIAKIWVHTNDPEAAVQCAKVRLEADGCRVRNIVETTGTGKDDYFPPCTSLDAFERAEREGLCVLYT